MKNVAIVILSLLFVLSCSSDDDNQNETIDSEVIGNWKLIEVYADPGDGSGDFVSVESAKLIGFEANGSFNANADLCLIFSETGGTSSGTFSEIDMTISIADCDVFPSLATYEVMDSRLIISYPCIEGCQEKYIKVE